MDNKYDYSVKRVGNSVSYKIIRDGVDLTERTVEWIDLGVIKAIFFVSPGSEKAINAQMKKAHELARFAIKSLIKYETQ